MRTAFYIRYGFFAGSTTSVIAKKSHGLHKINARLLLENCLVFSPFNIYRYSQLIGIIKTVALLDWPFRTLIHPVL